MTSKQNVQRALVGTALAASLAACGSGGGGGGSDNPSNPPPTVVQTAQEDKFGVAFGTDFRAAMNTSEPASVSDSDLVAVSLTTEPIDITP
jgi:hypothetical protein